MLASRCAGNGKNQRVRGWRYDAALLLATKCGMDVSAAIVSAPNLKAFDGHLVLPSSLCSLNKSRYLIYELDRLMIV